MAVLVHLGSQTSIQRHSSGLGFRVRRELHPPPAVTLRNSAFGHTLFICVCRTILTINADHFPEHLLPTCILGGLQTVIGDVWIAVL